jgi:transposase
MKGVGTIARIRREFFVHGKTIKQIARELHVARNTVRKVLRSGATEFRYERERQPLPRIGPWKEDLDRLLALNDAKPTRERLTLIRLFEELRGLGYEGSYDAVRRYARSWRREQSTSATTVFVPLSFAPGEAYQFDWSHELPVRLEP